MGQTDLLERLREKHDSFSKGQKLIAGYILENYDQAAFITASKMGHAVGVSESTVVRFAYTLGYDGYPELQHALQEVIRNKLTTMQRIQLSSGIDQDNVLKTVMKADMQNIRETMDTIDEAAFQGAVNALLCAPHIYVVGTRSAYPIAQFLSYHLRFLCADASVSINGTLTDAIEQMSYIDKKDVCVAVSFPRYSTRTVEAIRFARDSGAITVAITDASSSPLIPYADYALTARSDMASFADSLVAPLSLINAIIVAAGLNRKDALMEHFVRLEHIWSRQNVYMTTPPQGEKQL